MDNFLYMCLFAIFPADLTLVIVLYASWVSELNRDANSVVQGVVNGRVANMWR